MWTRYQLEDFRIVGHFLGVILILLGAAMGIPLFVALINREWQPACDFLLSMGITMSVGSAMLLLKLKTPSLNGRQAILLTGLTWVFISFFGAIPFYLSGHHASFINAFFESVSAYTTTGVSILQDPHHLAYSHNIWRLMSMIIGAQGIIAFAMTVGIFSRSSGAGSLYKAEGKSDSVLPNIIATVRFSIIITCAFVLLGTFVLTIAGFFQGMSVSRSLYHAFYLSGSAFSTGGFTPMANNVIYYHSVIFESTLMILMISGAMNFSLFFTMWGGNFKEFFKNIEVKTLAIWAIIVVVIMGTALAHDSALGGSVFTLMRRGVFTVISSISGTGFQTLYTAQFAIAAGPAVMFAIVLAMGFGGSTGSTSGGIKALRIALIVKSVIADVKRALSPDRAAVRVKYHHMGERVLDSQTASSAMTVFLLYVITYLIGTMIYVSLGYAPMNAAFDSIAATSNAGMSSGVISADMPMLMKVVFILQMWGGRLEFIALLALFAGLFVTFRPQALKEKFKEMRESHE